MNINLSTSVSQLGGGIFGLNLLAALDRAGHQVALWTASEDITAEYSGLVERALGRKLRYDSTAPSVSCRPDYTEYPGKGLRAPVLIFESDRLPPDLVHTCRQQDVLFALTEWGAEVVRSHRELRGHPVHVVRHGVDRSIFNEEIARNPQTGGPTRFLGIGKWELRKGQDFLIDAFNQAFEPGDPVELWMAATNPFLSLEQNNAWRIRCRSSKMGESVKLLHKRVSSQVELLPLIAQADCGLFLSRAEGWNLPLLEMMSCGKHVIATHYSGHTEFCTRENACLVDIDALEPAKPSVPFDCFGNWAQLGEAQRDQCVEHLRSIHRRKQDGELGINLPGVETAKAFTWDDVAQRLVAGLTN